MPALTERAHGYLPEVGGQALDKARGRKPRDAAGRSERARGYGDLSRSIAS